MHYLIRKATVAWDTRIRKWVEGPYGLSALCVVSFTESIFFPLPVDPLIMALSMVNPKRWFSYGVFSTLFSVLGAIVGYKIGLFFWSDFQNFFLTYITTEEILEKVTSLFNENAFVTIFLSGFTPLPYKVFAIAAGLLQTSFPLFVFASLLSRGLRFICIAFLCAKYGKKIYEFLTKNLFWTTAVLGIFIFGLYIVWKWIS